MPEHSVLFVRYLVKETLVLIWNIWLAEGIEKLACIICYAAALVSFSPLYCGYFMNTRNWIWLMSSRNWLVF